MDDLTVRLRRGFGGMVPPVCDEAANEIERLRKIITTERDGQVRVKKIIDECAYQLANAYSA